MEDLKEFIARQIEQNPIEAKIVKKVFKAMAKAGNPVVSVWDGEEDHPATTLEEVNTYVFNLDQAHLYTKSGAWVFLVLGNEWDTISDYNVSLEEALQPVNDWVVKNW